MTAFLLGLIGRARGDVPVLARRQPSMFEPDVAHAGRHAASSQSMPAVDDLPTAETRAGFAFDRVRGVRDAPTGDTPDAIAALARESGFISLQPSLQRPVATARELAQRNDDDAEPAGKRSRAPGDDGRPTIRAAQKDSETSTVPIIPADPAPRKRPPREDGHRSPPREFDPEHAPRDSGVGAKPYADGRTNATPFPVAREAKSESPALDQAALRTRAMQPRPAAQPAHAPVNDIPRPVEISIGRIEVRAVAMPSVNVARNVKTSPPRLSLEDYLRDRTRSRR